MQTVEDKTISVDLKFQSLLKINTMGIAFFNLQGKMIECNLACAELYGILPENLIGKSLLECIAPEDRILNEKPIADLLLGQSISVSSEFKITEPNPLHPRHLELKCQPMLSSNQQRLGFVATFQDITEKIQIKGSIETTAKLAALGEMAGGIAHEINNPLSVVQLRTTQLLNRLLVDEFTQEMGIEQLNKILSTTERIAKIIRGLKAFTRDAKLDPTKKVEISELIENIIGLCSEKFASLGIDLRVSTVPHVSVECRAVQIEQVIVNLLNNANDAISTLSSKWIQIDFRVLKNNIQIILTDSGPGIPGHLLEKIMQPFFTTKEVGKGTGLGLSISKKIMEAHGGRLVYDSSCKNTRFLVELPFQSI